MASRHKSNIRAAFWFGLLVLYVCLFYFVLSTNTNGTYFIYKGSELTKSTKLKWDKILHFIPDKTNKDCLQLFPSLAMKNIKMYSQMRLYNKYMEEYTEETKQMASQFKKDNTTTIKMHKKILQTYQMLTQNDWVKRICQIGFKNGRVAMAFLSADPGLKVHIFEADINEEALRRAKLVKKMFMKRCLIHVEPVASLQSVWVDKMKGKCDVIFIDGGHELAQDLTQYMRLRKIASRKHIIISEHLQFPSVNRTWNMMVDLGMVFEQYRCHINNQNGDLVIGEFGYFFWKHETKEF